ncbi:sensor histidine kinase [Nocardioides abyssi]|uniref:histidine kinase n=1 Tax=Nocardioides abyssi TaxID=3058370 RepID=A0ABT8EU86_9ACTN|nr:HAMP domain-containing sensor histidine kinase [Nocardioides abyssi]MDN4161752.1 HAMP domain-containing sensor histidine kinase [Nocardioides abyssi]
MGQSLVASATVALPFALLWWLAPRVRDLQRLVLVHELFLHPFVLAAGALIYVCWRITGRPTTAWLAAGVVVVGLQGFATAAVRVGRPSALTQHAGWLVGVDLLLAAVLVGIAALAAHRVLLVDPFVAGAGVGAVLVMARVWVLELPTLPIGSSLADGAAVLVLAAHVLTVGLVARLPRAEVALRARIGAAIVLLAVGRFLTPSGGANDAAGVAALLFDVLGTGVLLAAAVALIRVVGGEVLGLNVRLERLEAELREGRARQHEVGATIAGIASASHLLQTQRTMPAGSRQTLERMIDSEAARLQRLMDDRPVGAVVATDLDAVLEPLLVAHRSRGRVVRWRPGGVVATCRPDDVAEVVNILLENAAQHGGPGVTVATLVGDGSVEIRVSDEGPGVPAAIARRIFEWGERRAGSTGQGIGLHVARRLMVEQGGDLHLAPGDPGAVFVATLPAVAPSPPPVGSGAGRP